MAEKSEKKVLIVDDDKAVRETIEEIVDLKGYETLSCSNGAKALEIVQGGGISLVISDLNMPKMNGLDLNFRIKSQCPDLPVIIVTGDPNLMPDRIIEKPFNLQDLLEAVEKLIEP